MDLMNIYKITVYSKLNQKPVIYFCDNWNFDSNMLFISLGQDEQYVIPRENISFYSVERSQGPQKQDLPEQDQNSGEL